MHSQHLPPAQAVISLPDPLSHWPWPRRLNKFYEPTKLASTEWIGSYKAFSPQAQKKFDKGAFGLLGSLAWPDHNAEQLRLGCDLLQLFFLFDDQSDAVDEAGVQAMGACVMAALRDVHPPHCCVLGDITSDLWNRLKISMPNPTYQRRFIDGFQRYTDAVVEQAKDRAHASVRDITTYFPIRRDTVGTSPCWVLIHMAMQLSEDALNHPIIAELEQHATDLVVLCNDIHSYNIEQSRGDDTHNLVGIVIRQYGLSVHEAMEWVHNHSKTITAAFIEARSKLPSFGPEIDRELALYADGLGNWVRANDTWDFEGGRYFGNHGIQVRMTRTVALLPPAAVSPA